MGKTGLDFGIDIFLNLRPVLWLGWRVFWDQWSQITRVDGGENTALGDGVEVFDDLRRDPVSLRK